MRGAHITDDELPEGFRIVRGVCASVDFDAIRAVVKWEQRNVRIFGKEIAQPRLTCWYGPAGYKYSGLTMEANAMPYQISELRELAGNITGAYLNSCLANLYRDKQDSVAWHADDERGLVPHAAIASVSLGADRVFQIRHKHQPRDVSAIVLHHGDLLIMRGASQDYYQHAIPKSTIKVGPRVNLTFRNVLY